jgi:hypothetical protein
MPSAKPKPDSYTGVAEVGASVSPIRRWSFRLVVIVATLVLMVGLAPALKGLFLNWLPRDLFLAVRPDLARGDEVHRLHSTVVALLFWCLIIGLAAQLWHATEHVALLAMSLLVLVAEAMGELLSSTYTLLGTGVPLGIVILIAVLHPSRARISWIESWHRPSLVLAVVAAGPLGALAAAASEQQRATPPGSIDHGSGHLTFVAALSILLVELALLSASSVPGWRVVAWIAGSMASAFALQCLMFPSSLSAVTPYWALAAIAWAGCLVIVTERRVGASRRML